MILVGILIIGVISIVILKSGLLAKSNENIHDSGLNVDALSNVEVATPKYLLYSNFTAEENPDVPCKTTYQLTVCKPIWVMNAGGTVLRFTIYKYSNPTKLLEAYLLAYDKLVLELNSIPNYEKDHCYAYYWNGNSAQNATWSLGNASACDDFTPEVLPEISVSLSAPNGGSYSGNANISYNYTPAASNATFANCSLWNNQSDASAERTSNATAITSGLANTLIYNTTAGAHPATITWNVKCSNSTATVHASADYSSTLTQPPTIIGGYGTTIASSGNYVLTDNLTCAGTDGVTINANDVSLDCQNYESDGVTKVGKGIMLSAGRENINITNCAIKRFVNAIYSLWLNQNAYIKIHDNLIMDSDQRNLALDKVNHTTISYNFINNPKASYYGLDLYQGYFMTIDSNSFNFTLVANAHYGAYIYKIYSSAISNNTIAGSGVGTYGIKCPGGGVMAYVNISDNNVTGFDSGIRTASTMSYSNVICNKFFSISSKSIDDSSASPGYNNFSYNNITGGTYGFYLWNYGGSNVFQKNFAHNQNTYGFT